MSTDTAINGTQVVLRVKHSNGQFFNIGGQMSHTETLNNALIDITNKSSGQFRELLPEEGTQSIDFTIELTFNSETGYKYMRTLAGNKAEALFQVLVGTIATGFVRRVIILQVTSFADTSPDGDKLTASVSLQSSRNFDYVTNITYDKLFVLNGDDFITSNGNEYFVEAP